MGATILAAAALAAVIVIHLLSPRFRPLQLSAARLLADIPPAASRRLSIRIVPPFRSLAFWLQMLAALALLAAILLALLPRTLLPMQRVGLRLFVDHSLSMRLRDSDGASRMARGLALAEPALRRLAGEAGGALGGGFCAELVPFDTALPAQAPRYNSAAALLDAAEALPPGTGGTDLRPVMARLPVGIAAAEDSGEGCAITHQIVVTDRPAPALPAGTDPARTVWLDLGTPATDVYAGRVQLLGTGASRRLALDVGTAGLPFAATTVSLLDGTGQMLAQVPVTPAAPLQTVTLPAPAGGAVTLSIAAEDGLSDDNVTHLVLPEAGALPMLWPGAEPAFAARMGWAPQQAPGSDAAQPQFALGQLTAEGSTLAGLDLGPLPQLLLPASYGSAATRQTLGIFQPDHPLLHGLNLSALQLAPLSADALPDGFSPVLATADRRVLVATAASPPRLLLPALPRFDDSAGDRAVLLLLLNGLDWLQAQGGRNLGQSWQTATGAPLPDIAVEMAARDDAPRSSGDLAGLHAVAASEDRVQAQWPLLAAAALLAMIADRLRSGYRRVLA